jgi:hypothetical protein
VACFTPGSVSVTSSQGLFFLLIIFFQVFFIELSEPISRFFRHGSDKITVQQKEKRRINYIQLKILHGIILNKEKKQPIQSFITHGAPE